MANSTKPTGATAGPWLVDADENHPNHPDAFILDADGFVIARVQEHRGKGNLKEAIATRNANAHLIAAAPAVREALRAFVNHWDGHDQDEEWGYPQEDPIGCKILKNARAVLHAIDEDRKP